MAVPAANWSIVSGRPTPRATEHTKDAGDLAVTAIYEDVRRPQHNAFAGTLDAPRATGARESGEKRGFFVNACFYEFRNLFAFLCDVGRQFFEIGHGSPAPDQLHALRFNFLAFRIAW